MLLTNGDISNKTSSSWSVTHNKRF